jgi:hypothetical protein
MVQKKRESLREFIQRFCNKRNREATRKIAKWAIELSMYDIVYKPRTLIKAQALNDFMTEWTKTHTPPKEREPEYWTINFDRSLQLQGAGA